MNILFIHQNYPGQFKFLAPALVQQGHNVQAMTMQKLATTDASGSATAQGVTLIPYEPSMGSTANIHPWVVDFESKIIRAEGCFRAALKLKAQGFTPDVIIAHSGWGESLFLKEVWPDAKLGIYCEFFYRPQGADVNFDAEFRGSDEGDICKLRLKNLNNLLHFEVADAGISPPHWQASSFPESFRSRIAVVHDGIDTDVVAPNRKASLTLNGNIVLTPQDEVITFVNRNLEPYRGYHMIGEARQWVPDDKIVMGLDLAFDDMPLAVDYIRNLEMPEELQEKWGYAPVSEETKAKILGLNLARLAKIDPKKRV